MVGCIVVIAYNQSHLSYFQLFLLRLKPNFNPLRPDINMYILLTVLHVSFCTA